MSVQALQTHAKNEVVPFGINAGLTAVATYGGQYLPKVVEFLSFDMATEALGVGSALTALGGSLATVAGKTALGEDKYKSQAYQVATFALGAAIGAYVTPHAAAFAGIAVSFENVIALGAASLTAFVLRTIFSSGEATKPAAENKTKPEDLKKMSDEDFEKLAAKISAKTEKLTDEDSARIATDRSAIKVAGYKWDAGKYDAAFKDKKFDLEEYKKTAEKIAA